MHTSQVGCWSIASKVKHATGNRVLKTGLFVSLERNVSMGGVESNEELDDIADQIGESLGLPPDPETTKKKTTTTNMNNHSNENNLETLAEWLEKGQAKNIIVLSGAGVSTGVYIFFGDFVPSILVSEYLPFQLADACLRGVHIF
jgi:hypothetical protein